MKITRSSLSGCSNIYVGTFSENKVNRSFEMLMDYIRSSYSIDSNFKSKVLSGEIRFSRSLSYYCVVKIDCEGTYQHNYKRDTKVDFDIVYNDGSRISNAFSADAVERGVATHNVSSPHNLWYGVTRSNRRIELSVGQIQSQISYNNFRRVGNIDSLDLYEHDEFYYPSEQETVAYLKKELKDQLRGSFNTNVTYYRDAYLIPVITYGVNYNGLSYSIDINLMSLNGERLMDVDLPKDTSSKKGISKFEIGEGFIAFTSVGFEVLVVVLSVIGMINGVSGCLLSIIASVVGAILTFKFKDEVYEAKYIVIMWIVNALALFLYIASHIWR